MSEQIKEGWQGYADTFRIGNERLKCAASRGLTGCWNCKSLKEAFHCEEWFKFSFSAKVVQEIKRRFKIAKR